MSIPSQMKIAHNETFGPPQVVKVIEVPLPVVKRFEILVRVGASTVSAADWRLRSRNVPRGFGFIMGLLFGFKKPKYQSLGTELAGEVVAVGDRVTRFRIGDRIVANLGMKLGGHAEYAALPEQAPIAKLPAGVSTVDAAALVFGGTTALVFLRDKLKLKSSERLLVIGAGGAVGSAAIQLGRKMGAHVTGVCSGSKATLVKSLGVDSVIDYHQGDWRRTSERYDVIIDTVGGTTFENTRHLLTESGRIGLIVADLPLTLKSAWVSLFHQQKVYAGPITESAADLEYLLTLCEQGRFKPVIGAVFPLEQVVQAHESVESGHKLGNTVLKMHE